LLDDPSAKLVKMCSQNQRTSPESPADKNWPWQHSIRIYQIWNNSLARSVT